MKDCDRVDSLLSLILEHEASPAEATFVEGHLTACPRCRRQLGDLEDLRNRLRFFPRTQVSAGFTERVLEAVAGRPPAGLEEPIVPVVSTWSHRWGGGLAAAAAVVIVGGLALLKLSGGGAPVSEPGLAGRTPPTSVAVTEPAAPNPEAADGRSLAAPDAPATPSPDSPPVAVSLEETDPGLRVEGLGRATSLGMATYVLEDWMLREPAGGGAAVLTRVAADTTAPVLITF